MHFIKYLLIPGTIISIAFFNFAGITVTKELSATTRMILDSVRTLFIWGFSLIVSWQKFHPLQVFIYLKCCLLNMTCIFFFKYGVKWSL